MFVSTKIVIKYSAQKLPSNFCGIVYFKPYPAITKGD